MRCAFKGKCDHAPAVAAVGWTRVHLLCSLHAGIVLRLFPESPTFRWL